VLLKVRIPTERVTRHPLRHELTNENILLYHLHNIRFIG